MNSTLPDQTEIPKSCLFACLVHKKFEGQGKKFTRHPLSLNCWRHRSKKCKSVVRMQKPIKLKISSSGTDWLRGVFITCPAMQLTKGSKTPELSSPPPRCLWTLFISVICNLVLNYHDNPCWIFILLPLWLILPTCSHWSQAQRQMNLIGSIFSGLYWSSVRLLFWSFRLSWFIK